MISNRFNFIVPILVLVAVQLTYAQQNTVISTLIKSKEFRASVVKVNITPDAPKMLLGYGARKSTGVNDHIFHKIIWVKIYL